MYVCIKVNTCINLQYIALLHTNSILIKHVIIGQYHEMFYDFRDIPIIKNGSFQYLIIPSVSKKKKKNDPPPLS